MNKQLVNVIGAAASLAILVLGVLVFALPLFSGAQATSVAADEVARQNETQRTVLDGLRAQAADMSELESTVDALREEIPASPHLDDVLLLALRAASDNGGTVTSLTPAAAEPFAVRVETAEIGSAPSDGAPTESEDAAAETPPAEAAPVPSPADPASGADGPRQIAVTVVIETTGVDAATRIVDQLRAGPRIVAVTQASVTTGTAGGSTLTATVLAFTQP